MHNDVFGAAENRVNTEVPSLYVRVYHVQNICTESPYRSLIIREGISDGGEEE